MYVYILHTVLVHTVLDYEMIHVKSTENCLITLLKMIIIKKSQKRLRIFCMTY